MQCFEASAREAARHGCGLSCVRRFWKLHQNSGVFIYKDFGKTGAAMVFQGLLVFRDRENSHVYGFTKAQPVKCAQAFPMCRSLNPKPRVTEG